MKYLQYQQILSQWPEMDSPAFFHGWLVAHVLSLGAQPSSKQLLAVIQSQLKDDGVVPDDELQEFVFTQLESTLEGLNATDLSLELCLPDTDDLTLQALSIGQWCEGFVYVLGLKRDWYQRVEQAHREILLDMIQIAAIDASDVADVEDNAEHVMQLEEYLRVGVLTLHETLNPVSHPKVEVANHVH